MLIVAKVESTEADRLKASFDSATVLFRPVALLCMYASIRRFIYRPVVFSHVPFHGSLCDLITYREHVPVRICVVFQNPTWFLISYCLAGSSVPVHGLTAAPGPRDVGEGSVCPNETEGVGARLTWGESSPEALALTPH